MQIYAGDAQQRCAGADPEGAWGHMPPSTFQTIKKGEKEGAHWR